MARQDFTQPGRRTPTRGYRSKRARRRAELRRERHLRRERGAQRTKHSMQRIRRQRATDPNWGLPKGARSEAA